MTETTTRLEKIGSAAAGIAHDINNQLVLILNHLEMTDVQAARDAVTRCSSLTSNLLSYCRGEAPKTETMELSTFLAVFGASYRPPDGVELTISPPPLFGKISYVKTEYTALRRILTNLLTNACEAMNNQGSIVIRTGPGIIEVCDSGPGIPPERIKRIFEPFFTTKGDRGTGLGLAIVRELMRQHGGSVSVESEVGRGTKFTLRFR